MYYVDLALAMYISVGRLSRKCGILDISNPIDLHVLLQGQLYFTYFYLMLQSLLKEMKVTQIGSKSLKL
jgi:hypothetical protein